MKKLLIGIMAISAFSSEIQFGKGNFEIDAKFLGLDSSKNETITSFSLVNEHKNIFSSSLFYSYKISYFKSNTITTSATYLSSVLKYSPVNYTNNFLIYNKLRGLDINIVLGKDLVNKDKKDTYLGFGVLVGASFPYIKTNSNNNNTQEYLKDSKTKFYTYKLGLSFRGEKSFNNFLNFYANGNYAKQLARVKNEKLNLDASSDGEYYSFNLGVKLQAKTTTKIGFLTLNPSLFLTLGYRYDYWRVNDINIESLTINTDIKFEISQLYIGLGYDF